jgi:hypothetical protein
MGDEPRPLEDLEDDTVPETEGIDAHSATIVSVCGAVLSCEEACASRAAEALLPGRLSRCMDSMHAQ